MAIFVFKVCETFSVKYSPGDSYSIFFFFEIRKILMWQMNILLFENFFSAVMRTQDKPRSNSNRYSEIFWEVF